MLGCGEWSIEKLSLKEKSSNSTSINILFLLNKQSLIRKNKFQYTESRYRLATDTDI